MAAGLNKGEAQSLAQSSSALGNPPQNETLAYSSIFDMWSVSLAACTVQWNTVNVVYSVSSASGTFLHYLIITENPSLTQIARVWTEPGLSLSKSSSLTVSPSSSVNQGQFSGYEYYNSNSVTSVNAYWSIPNVTNPSSSPYCNSGYSGVSYTCESEFWVGETPTSIYYGNSPQQIAQGGTVEKYTCSNSTCSSGGTPKYYMFVLASSNSYNQVTACSPSGITYGNNIDATVSDSSGTYSVDILDYSLTSNNSCTASTSLFYTSYYAQFLSELGSNVNSPYNNWPLTNITSNFGSTVIFNCAVNGSPIYGTSYYAQYTMYNGHTNMQPSSVSSTRDLGSYFDQNYISSQGT